MLILIPAYEPDLRLVALVRELRASAPAASVLVVDDGSGPAFDGVFAVAEQAGAHLLRFPANRGKGAALKSGFAWATEHRPGEPVVCADCDGQHTPTDILRVADAVAHATMVLGGRRFTGRVPARSRFGNAVTRWVFRLVTGTSVHDTQTGLRGYPADVLPWLLAVDGERFEYESNLLLQARAAGVAVAEIPIETIYLDANASSHFRPLRDSLRIYAPLLRFGAVSSASAVVDFVGVLALYALSSHLLVSVLCARLVSGTLNFQLNRRYVFADAGDERTALVRYLGLAGGLLAANYALLALLVDAVGVPLAPAKVLIDVVLFVTSYAVQRRAVFTTPASVRTLRSSAPAPQAGAADAVATLAGPSR